MLILLLVLIRKFSSRELGTDKKVQFRDSAIYINSSVDGQLDIVADTEIQIAATTIDIKDVKTDLAITEAAAANSTSTLSLYSKFSDSQRGFVILKAESHASGTSDLVIKAQECFRLMQRD
jgi:hypothetical protein